MRESEKQTLVDTATPEHKRTELVAVETATHVIRGTISLPLEGYRARFSDYLNRADLDFISLTAAEKESLRGGGATRHDYLAVARSSILFAYPLGES